MKKETTINIEKKTQKKNISVSELICEIIEDSFKTYKLEDF